MADEVLSPAASSPVEGHRYGVGKWLVLGLLVMLAVVSYIDRSIITLLVDQIRADLQVTDVQIGLLQGLAFGLFYAVSTVPAGWMIDRFPRRYVLAAGFGLWTLAAAACGLARNYASLFVMRMGVGAGEAVVAPGAYSLCADLFRKNQLALAISIYAAGAAIGSGIALTVGGAVVEQTLRTGPISLPFIGLLKPWQLAFILTSLPALPLLFLILWIREPQRAGHGQAAATWGDLFRFMRSRRGNLTCHLLGFGLLSACTYGCAAWLPAYVMRHFEIGVAEAGMKIGLIGGISGVLGGPFSGLVVDWMLRRGKLDAHFRFFAVSAPLAAISAVIGFWLTSDLAIAVFIWGLLHFLWPFGGVAPAYLQIITPPRLRGRMSGFYVLVVNTFGLAIGPTLVAWLNETVFKDPADIGKAIALNFALLIPFATLFFVLGMRQARKLVGAEGDLG